MIVQQAPAHKFSIFNELITNDHREFYEKIINELIGVSPICNQGKCTAAAISETAYRARADYRVNGASRDIRSRIA